MHNSNILRSLAVIGLVQHVYAVPQAGYGSTTTPSGTWTTSTLSSSWTTSSQNSYPTTSPSSSSTSKSTKSSSGTTSSSSGSKTTSTSSTSSGTCSAPSGTTQSLSVASSAPSGAVQVPADFVGFGFETAFLNDYDNTFTENLINSIQQRVSPPIIIRIGGTSGDRVTIDPGQSEVKVCVAGDCPVGSSASFILGPSYFNGFTAFPNQHMTFQAPMGPTVNFTGSLDYVKRAYAALTAARTTAIALGNEPDSYSSQYNVNYTIQDYVTDALQLENRIESGLGLDNSTRIFEVLELADGEGGSTFSVEDAFEDGIDSNGLTKYAAQHYYQTPTSLTDFSVASEQTNLLNHSAIVARFQTGYTGALDYIEANDSAVTYVISETGSALAGPPKYYQDAFGAALWAVDFNLYAMSVGVKRLDSSQRPAAPHSLWVPDNSTNDPSLGSEQNVGPQVRGPWFAVPLVADFLGPNPGPVVEVLGEDTETAYAMYDASSGALSKVALVNLVFWASNSSTTRGSTVFPVAVGDGIDSVTVRRLHADEGAYAQGYDVAGNSSIITWAGETWSYDLDDGAGSLVSGVSQNETVAVCGGVAYVSVPDSEAVIVDIGSAGN